jgi:hypothetical protein
MVNSAAAQWINGTPWRWLRNGAIFGLLLILGTTALELLYGQPNFFSVVGLPLGLLYSLVNIVLCAFIFWIFGLATGRAYQHLLRLDDKSTHSAVKWLWAKYAAAGALLGLLLGIALFALYRSVGEVRSVSFASALFTGGLIGALVETRARANIRKLLARENNP